MKPAYPGTQSVRRALRLLKAFAEHEELGLPELSRRAGLNKTTAYRLLTALQSEGLVAHGANGSGYRLGPELLALGSRALGADELRNASRLELQALARQTRETASLEVLVGRQVLILDEALGGHVIGTTPSVGTRWPAHCTSTGKVLMAHLPEDEQEDLLSQPLAASTPRSITDPRVLRRELLRVRERGFAVSVEELESAYVAVAAPVRGADGSVTAAISVGGPKTRLTPGRLTRLSRTLPRAAARVSARLGHREL